MATEKQKNAIRNLLCYVRWEDISNKELRIINKMSFDTASRQIDKLIKEADHESLNTDREYVVEY